MKKLSVLGVALSLVTLGTPVRALAHPQEKKQEKPKLMDIKGTVKADGDKITFVNDSDGKSWNVVNPETLKDHVGHHVELSAHVYADKGEIHVMKVKML
jgi:membrane protein implicated in regulation of membrane protease activity